MYPIPCGRILSQHLRLILSHNRCAFKKSEESCPQSIAETFQTEAWAYSICTPSDIPLFFGGYVTFFNFRMMEPVPVDDWVPFVAVRIFMVRKRIQIDWDALQLCLHVEFTGTFPKSCFPVSSYLCLCTTYTTCWFGYNTKNVEHSEPVDVVGARASSASSCSHRDSSCTTAASRFKSILFLVPPRLSHFFYAVFDRGERLSLARRSSTTSTWCAT